MVVGRADGVFPGCQGAAGPMRGERGGLVGIAGLDTPRRVVACDERLAVGLPAELPRDRMTCHCLAVGRLRGGQPAFSLPGLGLDYGQARVACLCDQLAAALGERAVDQPGYPTGAVAPGQLHQVVLVRVDVHSNREQPRPRDTRIPGTVVPDQVYAVGCDQVRLGDHVSAWQRAVLQLGDQAQPAVVRDSADALRRHQLRGLVLGPGLVGFGLFGQAAQVIGHRAEIPGSRDGFAGKALAPGRAQVR